MNKETYLEKRISLAEQKRFNTLDTDKQRVIKENLEMGVFIDVSDNSEEIKQNG